jgi:hypothetical protein
MEIARAAATTAPGIALPASFAGMQSIGPATLSAATISPGGTRSR